MFNFDTGALYNKWTANWRAAQDPKTGDLPYTAPNYQDQGGGGPMWSGFCVTLPWQIYLQYGDKRVLETNYPTMQKWLAFVETKTVDNVLEHYLSYGMQHAAVEFPGRLGDPAARRAAGHLPRSAEHPVHQQPALPLHASTDVQDRRHPGQEGGRGEVRRRGRHAPADASRTLLRRRKGSLRGRRTAVSGLPAAGGRGSAGAARSRVRRTWSRPSW